MVDGQLLTKSVLWIGGTAYNAPAAMVRDYCSSVWRLCHVARDPLGSVTDVLDSVGGIIQELSYDAWGRLRDPVTGAVYAAGSEPEPYLLWRGFTGHEHLPEFGLVNMNARLYDPAVGRFLSPDPAVQLPDNTQGYNRYSYCLNNPLRYNDPSGRVFWLVPILVGALVGAATSSVTYFLVTPHKNYSCKGFWKSFGMGAFAGALGGLAGLGFSVLPASWGMGVAKYGLALTYQFIAQSVNYAVTNGVFGQPFHLYDILGIGVAALIGAAIPSFMPIKNARPFMNTLAETGYNALRGGATGAIQGTVRYAFGDPSSIIWQSAVGGAASASVRTLLWNGIMGHPVFFDAPGNHGGVYRVGGLAGLMFESKHGFTMGFNKFVSQISDVEYAQHEDGHIAQQLRLSGFGFYAQIILEYMRHDIRTAPLEKEIYQNQNNIPWHK